ncbi:MAG: PEP-CTERM sorting domain-containing protein [Rhizonema sp. PD37]|nr:PEP-CTERM sorting domain-containing protein [Rhizonema sp. PD37]
MLRRIIVGAIAVTGLIGVFSTSTKAATVTNISANNPDYPYLIAGQIISDQGYTLTYEQDTSFNQNGLPPLSYPTPFSDQASKNFLDSLSNPTTQDFNNLPSGTVVTSLPLNFGSAGTGTFQGQGTILAPNGSIYPQNNSNQLFAIGNRSIAANLPGSTYDEVDFSKPIGALGFSVSIPRFTTYSNTTLELTEIDGTIKQIGLPIVGTSENKISYIDVVAQSLSEQFTKIRFVGNSSRIQTFALGNITAANFSQIKSSTPVPEPTGTLGSLGAIAFGIVLRRKVKR